MSKKMFLSSDGYINVQEIVALAKEVDKVAADNNLRLQTIYYAGKVIPKFDADKPKDVMLKKRAIPVKTRSRMPPVGSRVKMQVLLKDYKGLQDFGDLDAEVGYAIEAIADHNARAERTIADNKEASAKKRAADSKAFDKASEEVLDLLVAAGVKEANIAVGMSMMGKTIIVKLPGGSYVSIGKADSERFNKAKESDADAPKAPAARTGRGQASTGGRTTRSSAKPTASGRAPRGAAKPASTRNTRPTARR